MRDVLMKSNRTLLLPVCVGLLLALGACGNAPEQESAEAPDGVESVADGEHAEESRTLLKLDAAAIKAAGIKVETLKPSVAEEQLRAPGEVLDNAYGTTLITPRVESLVIRRYAKLGDEVRAGAPLVRLSSVEVADAQAELRIAEQEWARVSSLGREAVAGRRITEAKVALDRARAMARAYGLPGTASGNASGEFTLQAPHAGRITEDNFVVGERIEPGRPLFRLVDESTVWVDAKLPPGVVSRIESGSPVTVVAGEDRLAGTVQRSAHRTSEATRNAEVRIEVPNKDDRLHAGDFVEVLFQAVADSGGGKGAQQLAVPTKAIVQLSGETVVFRRTEAGAFEPVSIRTGDAVGNQTIVLDGLDPGDAIVVEGSFGLKSQILKSQMGEGHGH